jgi:hypothetical protein
LPASQFASLPICQSASLGVQKTELHPYFTPGVKGLHTPPAATSHFEIQFARQPICQTANLPVSQRLSAVQPDWSANRQKMKRQSDITPAVNARLITVTKPITPPARMGARGLQKASPSD